MFVPLLYHGLLSLSRAILIYFVISLYLTLCISLLCI
nr:MAG TPA: hypothetical protein [Caudoviricetes sp.]